MSVTLLPIRRISAPPREGPAAPLSTEAEAPRLVPPPLARAAQLAEVFAQSRDMGATGFVLAQVPRERPIVWVLDRMAARQAGWPYGPGLRGFGVDPDRLVLVCARRAADVLWSMEEALACRSLGAVIGEIWGMPQALDFTVTKRLAIRAERAGVPCFLIRYAAEETLSAARRRWRVSSLASAPHPFDPRAPGAPRWHTALFRARDTKPGDWEAGYDRQAHRLDFSAAVSDPALAQEPERRFGN